MKKFKLLLLDANVVIHLFKLGIWDKVVEKCEIYLSSIVAKIEARFFETEGGKKHDIDLNPYIRKDIIMGSDPSCVLQPSTIVEITQYIDILHYLGAISIYS